MLWWIQAVMEIKPLENQALLRSRLMSSTAAQTRLFLTRSSFRYLSRAITRSQYPFCRCLDRFKGARVPKKHWQRPYKGLLPGSLRTKLGPSPGGRSEAQCHGSARTVPTGLPLPTRPRSPACLPSLRAAATVALTATPLAGGERQRPAVAHGWAPGGLRAASWHRFIQAMP